MKILNNEQWREMQQRIAHNKKDQETLAGLYAMIALGFIAVGIITVLILIN